MNAITSKKHAQCKNKKLGLALIRPLHRYILGIREAFPTVCIVIFGV